MFVCQLPCGVAIEDEIRGENVVGFEQGGGKAMK